MLCHCHVKNAALSGDYSIKLAQTCWPWLCWEAEVEEGGMHEGMRRWRREGGRLLWPPLFHPCPECLRLPLSLLICLQWYTGGLMQSAAELLKKHMLLLHCGLPAVSPSPCSWGNNVDTHIWKHALSLEPSSGNHKVQMQQWHNTIKTQHRKAPNKHNNIHVTGAEPRHASPDPYLPAAHWSSWRCPSPRTSHCSPRCHSWSSSGHWMPDSTSWRSGSSLKNGQSFWLQRRQGEKERHFID